MDVAEYVSEAITEVISYARVSERIRTTMESFRPGIQGLQDLLELEPALSPEIGSMVKNCEEILEALDRANTFLEARFDANQARLKETVTASDPDPS